VLWRDNSRRDILLGSLERSLARVIIPLFDAKLVRTQALVLFPEEVKTGDLQSSAKPQVLLNLYGNHDSGNRIGRFLSKNMVFLQHPKYPDEGLRYINPHILMTPGETIPITRSTETGGVLPPPKRRNPAWDSAVAINSLSASMLADSLDGLWDAEILPGNAPILDLLTPLLRWALSSLSIIPNEFAKIRPGIKARLYTFFENEKKAG